MRKASQIDEELLLCELGRALEETRFVPPDDRVLELRAMVCVRYPDGIRSPEGIANRDPAITPVRLPRVRSALVAAALGITMAGGGAAFAAGASLPAPMRAVAARIGLPVVPPAVVAVRSAEGELREQLRQVASKPESNHTAAVTKAAVVLAARVARLSPSQRQALGTAPAELLTLAHTYTPLAPAPPTVVAPRPGIVSITGPPTVVATSPAVPGALAAVPVATTPEAHMIGPVFSSLPTSRYPVPTQPFASQARHRASGPPSVSGGHGRNRSSGSHRSTTPTRFGSGLASGAALPAMMLSAQR